MSKTGFDLFTDRSVVAMRVNGELKDLAATVSESDAVEPVAIDSEDGLGILRHSAAHVTAQAVQSINPEARLGIGPPIADGFYYDFDVAEPFTPEDLKAIEKAMDRIIRQGQRFQRRVVSEAQARAEMADEPYKLELIGLKGAGDDNESVEVGGAELTIYDNVDGKTGEVYWKDLCRGPHLPNTRMIGNGWKLQRNAAAYWRGSEKNKQLQRIYGTAWPTKDELRAYLERQEEAAKRDHRKLGAELDLFSFPEEIGSGLAVFHPKGGIIRAEIENYMRERLIANDYELVNTPHITKGHLYEISQHLNWYKDGMFPPMHLDEERDADGHITRQGQDYYLKPMNCPMHNLIFRARGRSYRELPLRLAEFGTVYRYEKSGTLQGLTRVRGLTQDDAHVYVAPDQVKAELASQLEFVLETLRGYGLDDFYLELSTQGPREVRRHRRRSGMRRPRSCARSRPSPGSNSSTIRAAPRSTDRRSRCRPGMRSAAPGSCRPCSWTSTSPSSSNSSTRGSDGTKQQPVMIHRALLGSIERFFAILLEHYAGAFPVWLSPVQVVGIPVAEDHEAYLGEVIGRLKGLGVRAELDAGNDRMQKKIRTHTLQKVPFQLIAGAEDAANGSVSFRFRDGSQENGIPVDDAIDRITQAIATKAQV